MNKEKVKQVLDKIRPGLQADGGDVKLINVNDNGIIEVELQGACRGCPMSELTLKNGIERTLKENIDGVEEVQEV